MREEGLTVLMVDVGGLSAQEARDYYLGQLGGGDHLYGEDKALKLAEKYEVRALGTTVVIDRKGVITFRDEGVSDPQLLREEIRSALG